MVKVLNRDKIQRMVDYTGGAGTQSGSGGGGEGVSQAWVNANFVSIAYFEQLFKAYKPAEQSGDPDVEVKPNTIDEDITNIKAMKGFWTEQYISALGQGSGGGGGGGASALTDLVDVSISSPSSGQVLMYDGNGHWINGSISMSGYATQAWVQQQGYLTSASAAETYLSKTNAASTYLSKTDALATYLSKTDAASTYLSKTDAANTYLSIAFFSRLFQAYNGSTAVNPNDTSSTIDNIKAMFGFWTEQYISALGQGSGGGGGGASALGDLVDVTISSPSSGQVLMYDGNGHWINGSISMSGYATQAWVQEQGYATQSYLQQNYLPLSGGTLTGTLIGRKFHSNANSSIDLTHIPSDTEIALETGNGDGVVSAWIWREQYSSSNWGLFHDNINDVVHFVGASTSRFSVNLINGAVKVGNYDVIHSGNIGSQSVNYATTAGSAPASDVYAWAKASVKPSYSFSELISHPTTISGYGITDAITTDNIGSQSVNYAASAGNADTVDGYHSYGLLTRFSMGDPQSGEDSSKLYLGIGGATPTPITVGYASSAYSSTYADYADRLLYTRKIWGKDFNGSDDVKGNLTLGANNYLFLTGTSYSNGSYIIGRSGGIAIAVGGSSYEKFAFYQSKFYANAEIEAETGVYSHGYVTALSDVRLKKIIDRFTLKPEAIALASLIHYTWKKGHDDSVHVGGIAQEWQEILPEAVHDIDGRLTMDYGVIGMVSAVSLAKTVIEQEKRIKSLEERLAAIEAKLQ